jgi:hypothetical protein
MTDATYSVNAAAVSSAMTLWVALSVITSAKASIRH